jgi:class 3 adenylate cyclase
MDGADLTLNELKSLRSLTRMVDDQLEQSLLNRENVEATFRRLFPRVLEATGALGIVVATVDEELRDAVFHEGEFGSVFPGTMLAESPHGVRATARGDTFVSQTLDLVGHRVGTIGILFQGDRIQEAVRLARQLESIAEELDTVLAAVHTASEKHQLLVASNRSLSNPVFEVGMDGAVRLLSERVRLPGTLLLYRDAVEASRLHYRMYQHGQLQHASNGTRHEALEGLIQKYGSSLLEAKEPHLAGVLGAGRQAESVLISGLKGSNALGKILVWSGGAGFSAFTMDLLHLLASTLSQRLVDYNRERTHLAQFFAQDTINELLRDPDYVQHNLAPRAEEVGILFADINSFTRICEEVLERPERIGTFVDDWSDEAVHILHRHGGVFDKMVGDCVIGLFGPPFFKDTRQSRAASALKAALEIQQFTRETMSAHPELAGLHEKLDMPGLGVAVGVNLSLSFCGLFGPNRNYTAFSTGMNQTARLQSLGGFRETLVMDSALDALAGCSDPVISGLRFSDTLESRVKNVAQPLRYVRVEAFPPSP